MPSDRSVTLASDMQYKNLLFDFYGGLLTDKQRDCFSMHYMEDLSLAEIGEQSGITPQAVADLLKRSCALLEKYESQLSLVEKLASQQSHVNNINDQLAVISQTAKTAGLDGISNITDDIRLMINEILL